MADGNAYVRHERHHARLADAEARVKALVTPSLFSLEDKEPGAFSNHIIVGNARHAFAVDKFSERRITAVLNLAPKACADVSARYAERGVAYLALDAEDEEGFALVDKYLNATCAFLSRVKADGGVALVHCFAGVNRSAALAVAHLMLSERRPLEDIVRQCYSARPFILTNSSFRAQLVALAAREGLLKCSVVAPPAVAPALAELPSAALAPARAAAAAPPAAAAASGPEFTLGELLGAGAFASVYRCTLTSGREAAAEVAAKVVSRHAKWMWVGGKSVKSERAFESLQASSLLIASHLFWSLLITSDHF